MFCIILYVLQHILTLHAYLNQSKFLAGQIKCYLHSYLIKNTTNDITLSLFISHFVCLTIDLIEYALDEGLNSKLDACLDELQGEYMDPG